MISSYQLSERYSFQTLLWDSCGLIVAGVRKAAVIVGRVSAILSHLAAFLPTLLFALGLTAGLVAVVAAVACIPVQFWAGLLVVGAFGWATFPRAKVVRK